MILGLPCNGDTVSEGICPSFGRAPYYMVYNLETKDMKFVENPASVSPGGAGVKAAQFIVDLKVDVLLTPRCGDNAGDIIKAANIKMYKTAGDDVLKNVSAFELGELHELVETHAGFHHHG